MLSVLRTTLIAMLCDLNVPWPGDFTRKPSADETRRLRQVVITLSHLGYTHIAFNLTVPGDSKITLPQPIDVSIVKDIPIKVFTRITLIVLDPAQCHLIAKLNNQFDLISIQPESEKALIFAAGLDIDIITFALGVKLPYYLKHKTVCGATDKGIKFELSYAAMVMGYEPLVLTPVGLPRTNFFYNAHQLIRLLRSRGLIASLGAQALSQCRSGHDITVLLKTLGLDSARAKATVSDSPERALLRGRLRIKLYKQTVEPVERDRKRGGDNDAVGLLKRAKLGAKQ